MTRHVKYRGHFVSLRCGLLKCSEGLAVYRMPSLHSHAAPSAAEPLWILGSLTTGDIHSDLVRLISLRHTKLWMARGIRRSFAVTSHTRVMAIGKCWGVATVTVRTFRCNATPFLHVSNWYKVLVRRHRSDGSTRRTLWTLWWVLITSHHTVLKSLYEADRICHAGVCFHIIDVYTIGV